MNKFLARSVMRRLVSGGDNSLYLSVLAAPVDGMVKMSAVRHFDDAVLVGSRRFGIFGGLGRRMLSTSPGAVEKEQKKEDGEVSAKQEQEKSNEIAHSSYWGISRQRILREDGSEWPWNCFMVTSETRLIKLYSYYRFTSIVAYIHQKKKKVNSCLSYSIYTCLPPIILMKFSIAFFMLRKFIACVPEVCYIIYLLV